MTGRELELKSLKRAAWRAKRKCASGWMTATVILLVLTILLLPASVAAQWADNVVATRFDGAFWTLEGKDANARFQANGQAPVASEAETLNRLQQEAIVLLKNENGALPLQQAGVDCKGDPEKAASLQSALKEKGLSDGSGAVIVLLKKDDSALLQELSQKRASGAIQTLILLWDTDQAVQPQIWKDCSADAVLWTGGASASVIASILTGTAPTGTLPYTAAYGENPAAGSIYAGYKYYETRYEDYVMGTENTGTFAYREQVIYPFGFGLSYTSFSYSDFKAEFDALTDLFDVTVTVTNTGSIATHHTVQIYAQSPYTDYDRENGVEKSAVKLVGFAKTEQLRPGEGATVTVQVQRSELAAYDAKGTGSYILDAGDYYLTIADDAHNATNNILAAKGYTVESTQGRMDADGDVALTYQWTQTGLDTESYRGTTENRFTEATSTVSRQDWEGTLGQTTAEPQNTYAAYNPGDYATVSMPTMNAQNGLTLYDMKGLAFDDPQWQTLLDQLTFAEMAKLLGDAYRWTMPAESIQAPGACLGDMSGDVSEVFLMAAFDAQGMYDLGWWAGNTAISNDETALRCFGADFEDSFLTGTLRAQQAKGIYANGVNVLMRSESTPVYDSEQAVREQYLQVYRYTAEQLPTTGMALSGQAKEMLTVLRQEWGGYGMVVAADGSADTGVLSGITLFAGKLPKAEKALSAYEDDPVVVSAMRQACHYNLYAIANSAAMDGVGENTQVKTQVLPVVKLLVVLMVLCAAATVVLGMLWRQGLRKWKRSATYLDYQTLKRTLQEQEQPAEPTAEPEEALAELEETPEEILEETPAQPEMPFVESDMNSTEKLSEEQS